MTSKLPDPFRQLLLGRDLLRPRFFILSLLFRASNMLARQWTTFSCKLATLVFVVLLIACSERDTWAEFAAAHDCKTYDGVVWKCMEPAPTFWYVKDKNNK